MPFIVENQRPWSKIGLRIGVASIVAVVVLSLVDGVLRPQVTGYRGGLYETFSFDTLTMLSIWLTDFRYMFEQLIYVGAIVFVGGKFIENRTLFTVGFAKLDADRVLLQGPDENNIVWIGQRYGSAVEAQTVADAVKNRIEDGREK